PAYIYNTKNVRFDSKPLEDFNHISWFDPETAISKLKRGSHKWGVQEWLKK
ncbi:MAG: NUDIX hydrolase, partial [Lactococcus lactis]